MKYRGDCGTAPATPGLLKSSIVIFGRRPNTWIRGRSLGPQGVGSIKHPGILACSLWNITSGSTVAGGRQQSWILASYFMAGHCIQFIAISGATETMCHLHWTTNYSDHYHCQDQTLNWKTEFVGELLSRFYCVVTIRYTVLSRLELAQFQLVSEQR